MTDIRLKYIDSFEDRFGRRHYYFRRNRQRAPLPGLPGSREFMEAYAAALEESEPTAMPRREPAKAKTFADLATRYFNSPHFLGLSPTSRANYRRIIDHFVTEHGHRRVDQLRRAHVVAIMGKMADRPGAAITLLKRVRTLINFAIELEWIDTDPTKRVRSYKSKEFHTWTEDEIAQFEAHWPIGTPQRLAFAILLFTGQRGSDARAMARPDAEGKVRVIQQKTGAKLVIACHPDLLAALSALPKEHVTMLTTAYGEPFSVKGFGQFMSAAIRAAGLPAKCKAHGLRKAAARRLAEVGCTPHQIMSVTGHKTLAEVERYTRAAEQERLNQEALAKQLANKKVPNSPRQIAKPIENKGKSNGGGAP